jgi:hypothetical protein
VQLFHLLAVYEHLQWDPLLVRHVRCSCCSTPFPCIAQVAQGAALAALVVVNALAALEG